MLLKQTSCQSGIPSSRYCCNSLVTNQVALELSSTVTFERSLLSRSDSWRRDVGDGAHYRAVRLLLLLFWFATQHPAS